MRKTKDRFFISDEKSLLTGVAVQNLLKQSHWASDYTLEKIEILLSNSFCLGMFLNEELVGFCRLVTDKVTVTVITDLIIDESLRGKGLGTWLLRCIVDHPELKKTSMTLGTPDQDSFYSKFDFDRSSVLHRVPRPSSKPRKPTGVLKIKPLRRPDS